MSIDISKDDNDRPKMLSGKEGTSVRCSFVKTDPKKLFKTLAVSISSVVMDPSILCTNWLLRFRFTQNIPQKSFWIVCYIISYVLFKITCTCGFSHSQGTDGTALHELSSTSHYNFLAEFSTDYLTAWLMPSDKRNAMGKATGLKFSCLTSPQPWEVPFGISQYAQWINSSWTYHCPSLWTVVNSKKCRFGGCV